MHLMCEKIISRHIKKLLLFAHFLSHFPTLYKYLKMIQKKISRSLIILNCQNNGKNNLRHLVQWTCTYSRFRHCADIPPDYTRDDYSNYNQDNKGNEFFVR